MPGSFIGLDHAALDIHLVKAIRRGPCRMAGREPDWPTVSKARLLLRCHQVRPRGAPFATRGAAILSLARRTHLSRRLLLTLALPVPHLALCSYPCTEHRRPVPLRR